MEIHLHRTSRGHQLKIQGSYTKNACPHVIGDMDTHGGVTILTKLAPLGNVLMHPVPYRVVNAQVLGPTEARMVESVEGMKAFLYRAGGMTGCRSRQLTS